MQIDATGSQHGALCSEHTITVHSRADASEPVEAIRVPPPASFGQPGVIVDRAKPQ